MRGPLDEAGAGGDVENAKNGANAKKCTGSDVPSDAEQAVARRDERGRWSPSREWRRRVRVVRAGGLIGAACAAVSVVSVTLANGEGGSGVTGDTGGMVLECCMRGTSGWRVRCGGGDKKEAEKIGSGALEGAAGVSGVGAFRRQGGHTSKIGAFGYTLRHAPCPGDWVTFNTLNERAQDVS